MHLKMQVWRPSAHSLPDCANTTSPISIKDALDEEALILGAQVVSSASFQMVFRNVRTPLEQSDPQG